MLREAQRLGLRGFCSNLPDGTVEVVADGEDAALSQLERALGRGPPGARVLDVEKLDVPHEVGVPKTFEIN